MGIHDDDACNIGLVLRLGLSSTVESPSKPDSNQTPSKNPSFLKFEATNFDDEPSLTLGLSSSGGGGDSYQVTTAATQKVDVKPAGDLYRQASIVSAVSLLSSGKVKREREVSSEELMEVEKNNNNSSRLSDEDEEGVNGRKKLRLSKQQSALLEESFKQHSTLSPKQKQALARQLNLKTRQVEVWFQNRRARTKLKQTEVDCELLKKCCETLTDENRRLQKEIQELKALKLTQPFYMHMQAATLTMCPSCEITTGVGDANGNSNNPFLMASKPHHFHNNNPLSNPSAAC
ncbi:Homeobox-leucine zipper protein HOX27 [Hibiscus syriacus]|uniref:Homeobox-leucine zipper protein HOX27 n=1 Tax=Hibiscus syriacus TaxID=106335 RepID=A0A6A2ZP92_HIBSY|nr:homeobox-leucine zipper protein HAT22-like [Hibiscus syriacus]KAE8693376.1 Homeobox-leucine zipper protein HOX27 [Hibiscus syriacus]